LQAAGGVEALGLAAFKRSGLLGQAGDSADAPSDQA
jgi:hypothetical protein